MRGEPFTGSNFKPPRGTWRIQLEQRAAKLAAAEDVIKREVKARDGCRWPEKHRCRGGLEAAHLHDESTGGDMTLENLIGLCVWIHRSGPESIHGKQLEIRPLTMRGTAGPCSFWRKRYLTARPGEYVWQLVAREVSPGVPEKG